jgi:uncharacterized protein (TIGR02594 family)
VTAVAIPAAPDVIVGVPPWLMSLEHYGTREIAGPKHSHKIVQWMDDFTTLPDALLADETAWCSVFANMAMQTHGYRGTRSASALSWLKYGVALERPRLGCIVVYWRGSPDSGQGHVAFYVAEHEDPRYQWVYGGNQHNRACIDEYPVERVLAYRWPTAAERIAHG